MTLVAYKFDITRGRPILSMRQKVDRLEKSICAVPQVECPLRHHFAQGMYAREMTIPKGTVAVGAIHKVENFLIVSKGKLQFVVEDGTQTVEAPAILIVKPGQKNAVHALEDSVLTNFYPTSETDLDKLTEMLTHSKASELLGGKDNPQLIAQRARDQLENEP